MEGTYQAGNPKTLQQAVFDGTIDPGQLVAVREIVAAPAGDTGVDTAVFLAPRASYTVVRNANGSVTVTQTGAVDRTTQKVSDGTDTLRNIERLQFSDQVLLLTTPAAPTNVAALATGNGQATVTWTAPVLPAGTSPITTFDVVVSRAGTPVTTITGIARTATSRVVTGLTNGQSYTFQVRANNLFGPGPLSAPSNAVTPQGPPRAPTNVAATSTVSGQATVTWTAPVLAAGAPSITSYDVVVTSGGATVRTITGVTATSTVVTGLTNGQAYSFRVRANSLSGTSALSAASNTVTPRGAPAAPTAVAATRGNASASLTWTPGSNGGSTVTSWIVTTRIGTTVVRTTTVPGSTPSTTITGLTNGTAYTFRVQAVNALGTSGLSPASNTVTPARVPNAPSSRPLHGDWPVVPSPPWRTGRPSRGRRTEVRPSSPTG